MCEPWGEPSEALQETAVRLRDEQLGRSRFVEHAIELLRSLREAGVRTGLLTNGPSWMQRRKVELLGLEGQLDAIGISEELGASKPDPAAFTATLELMGSAPDDTVMVGDHLDWDVRGALDRRDARRGVGRRRRGRARAAAGRPEGRAAGRGPRRARGAGVTDAAPRSGPAGST